MKLREKIQRNICSVFVATFVAYIILQWSCTGTFYGHYAYDLHFLLT